MQPCKPGSTSQFESVRRPSVPAGGLALRRDNYELLYNSDARFARGLDSARAAHTGIRVLLYESCRRADTRIEEWAACAGRSGRFMIRDDKKD